MKRYIKTVSAADIDTSIWHALAEEYIHEAIEEDEFLGEYAIKSPKDAATAGLAMLKESYKEAKICNELRYWREAFDLPKNLTLTQKLLVELKPIFVEVASTFNFSN